MHRSLLCLLVALPGWGEAQPSKPAQAAAAYQARDWEQAARLYQEILATQPSDEATLGNYGLVLYRLERWEEAESLLSEAVQSAPELARCWSALGLLAFRRGEVELAIAHHLRAVALEPENARVHGHLGVALYEKGWFLGAETELRRALQLDPDFADGHYNLAVIYLAKETPAIEMARRHYRRARDLGVPADEGIEAQLTPSEIEPSSP
ncbi:MAG: tetratricopeptide repeat protein [Verrucomicrobiota bacterium]